MTELLLGCGNRRSKQIQLKERPKEFEELITLDIDPNCGADVIHDLNELPWPFDENMFDEVHAYEVLEHFGAQGDWRAFFAHFSEIYRILKPDGILCATVPIWDSVWLWGDPGHTRAITAESLTYLNQQAYEQLGKSPMTDYRHWYKADFELIGYDELKAIGADESSLIAFVLRARGKDGG